MCTYRHVRAGPFRPGSHHRSLGIRCRLRMPQRCAMSRGGPRWFERVRPSRMAPVDGGRKSLREAPWARYPAILAWWTYEPDRCRIEPARGHCRRPVGSSSRREVSFRRRVPRAAPRCSMDYASAPRGSGAPGGNGEGDRRRCTRAYCVIL